MVVLKLNLSSSREYWKSIDDSHPNDSSTKGLAFCMWGGGRVAYFCGNRGSLYSSLNVNHRWLATFT